jgi:hypothetical protein
MLLLTETQVDRIVRQKGYYFCAGLALMIVPLYLPRGWGIGFFTGFMLVSLSIYGYSFRNWRTERGIWMLAALLIVVWTPCWLCFEYEHWRGVFPLPARNQNGQAFTWDKGRLVIDGTVALLLMAIELRLAVTVAKENWLRTRKRKTIPT